MFAPCSANVRATSSSRRGRSQESTAIWTRKLWLPPPSHSTGVNRSGLRHQRAHVRAVAAVDRDPLAERDVADDVVARNRCAALREPDEHVLDADHVDAVAVAAAASRARGFLRGTSLLGDLADLELLEDLVDDLEAVSFPEPSAM